MPLQLLSAEFDDARLGVSSTRTEDGQVLSVLFENLAIESQPDDQTQQPEVRRAEGTVQVAGTGWVTLQVRGTGVHTGDHGLAHGLLWANGRKLRLSPLGADTQYAAACAVPLRNGEPLRLSLLLLAQRDLQQAGSGAGFWVDSIDFAVHEPATRQRGGL